MVQIDKKKNKCGKPAPAAKEKIARYELAEEFEVIIQNAFEISKA